MEDENQMSFDDWDDEQREFMVSIQERDNERREERSFAPVNSDQNKSDPLFLRLAQTRSTWLKTTRAHDPVARIR